MARPTTVWSAPGARVNASNTAVPRTPDAPVQDEAYQSTERGAGIFQSSPVTMTFMGLITSPLIAIAPTRSRTHMIMTQCLTVLLYTQPTYSTHVNHLKVRSTTGHDKVQDTVTVCLTPRPNIGMNGRYHSGKHMLPIDALIFRTDLTLSG